MISDVKVSQENYISSISEAKQKKHVKITDVNYRNNSESDYTEKIKELDNNFNYADNSSHYWSKPELSILYGTPLYAEASASQKMALNHLYWATQYSQVAASEANTIMFNDVTNGVFSTLGSYETLCKELDLESDQERDHIHAFHKISYKTKRGILGKSAFSAPLEESQFKSIKKGSQSGINFDWVGSSSLAAEDKIFRLLKRMRLKTNPDCYSPYLNELEKKNLFLPGPRTGILRVFPRYLLRLFTLSWGSSSFLASQYYSFRYIANMMLKTVELDYTRHFRQLERMGEFIPAPTAVSRYHLLDESFHTTTSRLIAQDLYKDFAKPTDYEKFMGNLSIYTTQKGLLSGLSGGLPAIFQDDSWFMLAYYRLLRGPLFEMSVRDSLHWLEKCMCHEHEGFHVNLKYHQRFSSQLSDFFGSFDYMWPVNREMRILSAGGSIARATKKNSEFLKHFAESVSK
jgi:hypothetical protein